MSSATEPQDLKFGYQTPDYKRSQFSVRQTIMDSVNLMGANHNLTAAVASAQVEAPEASRPAEEVKKAKVDEKAAKVDEDDEKDLSLPEDFLPPAAPPVNVGYTLSLVGEDGKIKPLFPRENLAKVASTVVEKVSEENLPEDPVQRQEMLELRKFKAAQKAQQEMDRVLNQQRLEEKAGEFQRRFEESMKRLVLNDPLSKAELEGVDKGLWDAINRESMPALNGMNSLLDVVAKASTAQVATHSKLKTAHEHNIQLLERTKALNREKKQREEEIIQLKAQLEALREKTSAQTPLFSKPEERLKPKEAPLVPQSSVVKTEAKREREDAPQAQMDMTANSIFAQIIASQPGIPLEQAREAALALTSAFRGAGY